MLHVCGRRTGTTGFRGGLLVLVAASAMAMLCAGRVLAAEESAGGNAGAAAPQDISKITSLDEIVVTGRLDSLSGIRQALVDSESRFNARYNELNKDDRFDIVCRDEMPTGSHIARRHCYPKFMDEMGQQPGQMLTSGTGAASIDPVTSLGVPGGGDRTVWLQSPEMVQLSSMNELKRRTLALVNSDPDLKRDLLEHARLEQIYRQLGRKKFKLHLFRRD